MNNALKTIYFEDVEDLVCECMDKIYLLEDDYSITIVGKFNEIQKAIRCVLEYEDVNVENIVISNPEFSGYDDEYYLHIVLTDGEIEVCCEEARYEDMCVINYCDEAYILSNCGSKIVRYCGTKEKYVAIIGEEEDSEYDDIDNYGCCGCCAVSDGAEIIHDADGNICGFTINKNEGNSFKCAGYYTTDNITREELLEILKGYDVL